MNARSHPVGMWGLGRRQWQPRGTPVNHKNLGLEGNGFTASHVATSACLPLPATSTCSLGGWGYRAPQLHLQGSVSGRAV